MTEDFPVEQVRPDINSQTTAPPATELPINNDAPATTIPVAAEQSFPNNTSTPIEVQEASAATTPNDIETSVVETPEPQMTNPLEQINDPEIIKAGEKAVSRLLDGMPTDLSTDETAVIDALAERVKTQAQQEALIEKETSPEVLTFKSLEAIHDKLAAAGLDADAKEIEFQITQLRQVLDDATAIIEDPLVLADFERLPTNDRRLEYLMMQQKKPNSNLIYGVQLSTDLGNGTRAARNGFTHYRADEIPKFTDQIEQGGGLQPVLTDKALELILNEGGILPSGESLSSLDKVSDRADLDFFAYFRDLANGGNFRLENSLPGGQHLDYTVKAYDGAISRVVSIRMNPDFVINAALRRIHAK